MKRITHLVVVFLLLTSVSEAGRILAVFPFPGTSHLNVLNSLINGLAANGHDITVITPTPQKNVPKNLKQIDCSIKKEELMGDTDFYSIGDMKLLARAVLEPIVGKGICEKFFSKPNIQEYIQTSTDTFDVLITEAFFSDCVLGFAHKFQVPIIQVCAFGGTEQMGDYVGNPYFYSYIPDFKLNYGDHMTFFERLHNTITGVVMKVSTYLIYNPSQNSIMQQHFQGTGVGPVPHISELQRKTALLLLNNHVSLSSSRPYVPNIIEVGGMHIKPPKKLPADLQEFLDSSKDGVIYFSMGSNLKSSNMPEAMRDALLQAFGALKQKVLWKWDDDVLPGQPKNVKLGKWLPQSDLLAHPNVIIFLTHGGLLSTQEAVYHGKPVIGIPIFGDQKMNMNQAVLSGYGYLLPFHSITRELVSDAINTVLTTPDYTACAQRISRIFRDTPRTPLETAVFWSEYVMRHKGAYHMRSAALDLAWYQYYLLDVLAVLGGGALLVLALVFLTLRTLLRCCLPKKKAKAQDKKKRN